MLATFLFLFLALPSRANVYATDIRLNAWTNNATVIPGRSVQISYILNEPATAGASVLIYSGTNLVRSFSIASGAAGAMAGSNAVIWDGKNQTASNVPPGVYTIQITAAANGYTTWTNITDDGPAFQVPHPDGLAVNKNTNSPFYGRVFVSSAPNTGQSLGIFKFNADGSPADEGGFSTGGYPNPWTGPFPYYSPWKISISDDDKVYINNWSDDGLVMAFDELITSNDFIQVLGTNNYPYPSPQLDGLFVQGAGTNTQIWMTDFTMGGAGIVCWSVGADGTIASNDAGTTVVSSGGASDLNYAAFDVALDTNGNIYTIQSVDGLDGTYDDKSGCPTCSSMMRVFRFPPYSGQPETAALWSTGAGDNYLDLALGLAVDPSATFVAVAARGDGGGNGLGGGENLQNGGVSIFYAASGALITNIQQNAAGGTNMQCWDVAWDRVGNLYAADGSDDVWRAYSPPGTNHSTTLALPIVQVYQAFIPPALGGPVMGPDPAGVGPFEFTLQGQNNVTYLIEESPDLVNWNVVATSYSTTSVRTVTVQPTDQQGFYRAAVAPAFY